MKKIYELEEKAWELMDEVSNSLPVEKRTVFDNLLRVLDEKEEANIKAARKSKLELIMD